MMILISKKWVAKLCMSMTCLYKSFEDKWEKRIFEINLSTLIKYAKISAPLQSCVIDQSPTYFKTNE